MSCPACARSFHSECLRGCKKCHPKEKEIISITGSTATGEQKERKHGGTAEQLKDPKSTGRKRAAKLYPLDKSQPCEWRGNKNCGGGRRPIIGCVDGFQQHRHHGPVKNTTRNYEGNVHRICTRCHNHWHELNDLVYIEEEYAVLPHDPLAATAEELVNDEMLWRTGEMGKKYELASSKNKNWKAEE